MTKVILFNGPPGSGKDYATAFLLEALAEEDPIHMKLSKPLKDLVCDHFGLTFAELEEAKDMRDGVYKSTLRDYQISLFETISRVLGSDWLAINLVNRAKRFDNNIILISDVGRDIELVPFIKNFGARNILLLQLFRQGTTFKHDIRNYIDDPRITSELIKNDGTSQFKQEVLNSVYSFLTGE